MIELVKQPPYLARAVLHNFSQIEAGLVRRIPDLAISRTWRDTPQGVRVTLTITCAVKDARAAAEALVDQLRYLGFYADAAGHSPPAARVSGYHGKRF